MEFFEMIPWWIVFGVAAIACLLFSLIIRPKKIRLEQKVKELETEKAKGRTRAVVEELDRAKKEESKISNLYSNAIISFVMMLILATCSGCFTAIANDPNRNNVSTNTCGYCEKVYRAGDSGGNYISIAETGLCKKCYNTYKTAQEALDFINDNR